MAFWKTKEKKAESTEDYDILNDFRALEQDLRQRGLMGGKPHYLTTKYFLHLYRIQEWACGTHKPFPYPIELEPPHNFLSMKEINSIKRMPELHPSRWNQVEPDSWCRFTIAMSPETIPQPARQSNSGCP